MSSFAWINVSVSSHYRHPSYESEITSQGILGERVEILKSQRLFSQIRQADGYESWISTDQLADDRVVQEGWDVMVCSHFIRIYDTPDTRSTCIRDGVVGCLLRAVEEQGEWLRLFLPDGTAGWAEKKHFGTAREISSASIVDTAREFLGYQYSWGGRSPKGFDCSGFVQTVFLLHGIILPRDSYQQQQQSVLSTDFNDARPADLIFFGKTPERVTHVAISLGNNRFIHASGWIRINSLNKDDENFSEHHKQTFISVNRYHGASAK
ncbi:MAG: NlpC/P60 family protein [Desulforhopalus sp.]